MNRKDYQVLLEGWNKFLNESVSDIRKGDVLIDKDNMRHEVIEVSTEDVEDKSAGGAYTRQSAARKDPVITQIMRITVKNENGDEKDLSEDDLNDYVIEYKSDDV